MNFKISRSKVFVITAVIVLVADSAVPQLTQMPVPPQTPQAPPQPLDPVSVFAILLSGATAIFAIAPRLIEKWFGNEMAARQTKTELHTLITKSQAELELDEKKKDLEYANELSNFYLESAREGRKSEKELLMLFVTKELDRSAQTSDQMYELIQNQASMIRRLDAIEKYLQQMESNQKDIFAVLKMRDRGSNPE